MWHFGKRDQMDQKVSCRVILRCGGDVKMELRPVMKLPIFKISGIVQWKHGFYIGLTIASIVPLFALSGTFFAWNLVKKNVDNDARELFEKRTAEVESTFNRRLDVYLTALYSTRGIFGLRQDITAYDWHKYFEKSKVREQYPGMSTIGYIERVKSTEKTKLLENWKAESDINPTLRAQLAINPEAEKSE